MPAQKSGQCKRLSHFLCQGAIKENIKHNSVSTKKAWAFKCYKFGKENKKVINMDAKPVHHSDKGTFENSTGDDNGAVVETDAESEIPSQEAEPQTTEKSQVGGSISDLKERDANVVKLTTKDLEDLEKIQEELDSLTSYLPNSLQESNVSIHMKSDGLIDDQDHISPTLESNIKIETQNVNSDSAKVQSVVSDSIPVINNVISLSSTTMSPTIGSTSGASSEEHNISSGICGIKTLKLAPKPVPGTSVVIQTSTTSLDGSVVTTQPIAQTCVVSGLSSSCNNETVSNLQTFQQSHSSTVTPLLGHLTAVKSSDVKVILPQTSNPTQATLVSLPQLSTNNSGQAGLKRTPCATVTNQVITKVIITSNTATNQSAVTPLSGPLPATGTGTLITNDNLGQQSTILLASPTKAFPTSKPIANTAGTPRIIRSVPTTPQKHGVVVVSRMKSGKMPSPISFVKSPQRIAPAPNTGNNSSIISGSKITIVTATAAVSTPTLSTSIAKPVTIPSSPTKVILKPVVQTMKPSPGIVTNQSSAVVSSIDTSLKQMLPAAGNTVQQIQVPGSKFHYVRLVTAPTSQNASAQGAKQATLIPVTRPSSTSSQDSQNVSSVVSSGAAVRLTLPIAPIFSPQTQVSSKPVSTPQRMLIPASNVTSVSQVRTSNSIPAMTLRQLPTGTLLQAGSGILMLPAQYNLTQLQQTNQSQSNTIGPAPVVIQSIQPQNILPSPAPGSSSNSSAVQQGNFVPVAPATANQIFEQNSSQNLLSPLPRHHVNGRSTEVGESRLRKPCNCTKSQCLKLYCDCFANGEFCNHCNCNNCFNNLKHEEERQKAIKACLDRNPLAFHPKIGKGRDGVHERRHTKGCNCKRSGCLKNYCECYEAKILCTNLCKCIGCKNFEDSSERKTLMHLADAAEVRVQQQTAAKTKISSQIQDLPTRPPIISTTGERLPFAFVTQEVVEATCQCLLAQSEDGEKSKMPVSTLERLVLEEFGRCLMQIIEYANRTKVSNT